MWFLKEVIFVVNDTVRVSQIADTVGVSQIASNAWHTELWKLITSNALTSISIFSLFIALISLIYMISRDRRSRKEIQELQDQNCNLQKQVAALQEELKRIEPLLDFINDFVPAVNNAVKCASSKIYMVSTIPFLGDIPQEHVNGRIEWGEKFFKALCERLKAKPEIKENNFRFYHLPERSQRKLLAPTTSPEQRDNYFETYRNFLNALGNDYRLSFGEVDEAQLVFILCLTDNGASETWAFIGFYNMERYLEIYRSNLTDETKIEAGRKQFWGFKTKDEKLFEFFESIVKLHDKQRDLRVEGLKQVFTSFALDYCAVPVIDKDDSKSLFDRLMAILLFPQMANRLKETVKQSELTSCMSTVEKAFQELNEKYPDLSKKLREISDEWLEKDNEE